MAEGMENILNGEREIDNIDDLDIRAALILQQIIEAVENPEQLQSLIDQSQPRPDEERNEPAGEKVVDQQQLQIALAAALPVLRPEARPQVEPILDQMKQGSYTALAEAIANLWNGERDAAKLYEGLDEQDTATLRLALHFIEHPEEVEKLTGG